MVNCLSTLPLSLSAAVAPRPLVKYLCWHQVSFFLCVCVVWNDDVVLCPTVFSVGLNRGNVRWSRAKKSDKMRQERKSERDRQNRIRERQSEREGEGGVAAGAVDAYQFSTGTVRTKTEAQMGLPSVAGHPCCDRCKA